MGMIMLVGMAFGLIAIVVGSLAIRQKKGQQKVVAQASVRRTFIVSAMLAATASRIELELRKLPGLSAVAGYYDKSDWETGYFEIGHDGQYMDEQIRKIIEMHDVKVLEIR